MAASTIPPSEWPALLYRPPATAADPDVKMLPRMQLDDLHYSRQMLLCRGAGYSFSQCARVLQLDDQVSPPNSSEQLYKEQALATATCLSAQNGCTEKCRYFIESWHKMLNHETPPEPGLLQRSLHAAGKLLGIQQAKDT